MSDDPVEHELRRLGEMVGDVRDYTTEMGEPRDLFDAEHASAMIWSEYGSLDASTAAWEILNGAIQIGYMKAISDIRTGKIEGLGPRN